MAELTPQQSELVKSAVPMVQQMAFYHHVYDPVLEEGELRSVGLCGLVTVVQTFDESRGVDFEAYAKQRILGMMKNACEKARGGPLQSKTHARQQAEERASEHAPSPGNLRTVRATERKPVQLEDLVDPVTSLQTKFYREEIRQIAREMIDELDGDDRELALETIVGETSVREFARRKGIAHSTVWDRYVKLRQRLNDRFIEKYGDSGE